MTKRERDLDAAMWGILGCLMSGFLFALALSGCGGTPELRETSRLEAQAPETGRQPVDEAGAREASHDSGMPIADAMMPQEARAEAEAPEAALADAGLDGAAYAPCVPYVAGECGLKTYDCNPLSAQVVMVACRTVESDGAWLGRDRLIEAGCQEMGLLACGWTELCCPHLP